MDVVEYMERGYWSQYDPEPAIPTGLHKKPWYSMIPRDEWDDGVGGKWAGSKYDRKRKTYWWE